MASNSRCLGKRPLREPTPPSSPSSSSSAAPASPPSSSSPPPHHPDDDLHPFLQFTNVEDRRTFSRLWPKEQETSRCISWATLQTLQLEGRAREMLGPIWQRFFAISHPQYRLFTLEFFSTFSFTTPCHEYSFLYSIRFRLGGVERYCSLREFATRMGLYTPDELDSPLFDLPRGSHRPIILADHWDR